ncbi:hypothetical protein WJX84_000810 [Apatococcus fuscideae]|uniref:Uncharacterized protein n=1 Tax=Apatococcus fuscideae TaxID=2026836 RepID=A0AAW1SJU1_9CHLO
MHSRGDAARSDRPRDTWDSTDLPGGDAILADQFEDLQRRHAKSELENASLRMQLETMREDLRETHEKLIQAGVERDKNALRLQQLGAIRPTTAGANGGIPEGGNEAAEPEEQPGVIEQHLTRIADLERQVKQMKNMQRLYGASVKGQRKQSLMANGQTGLPASPGAMFNGPGTPGLPGTPMAGTPLGRLGSEYAASSSADELAEDDEFLAHESIFRMEQEKANRDLDSLERQLAAKQADMARMQTGSGQVVMLKQHYNRVLGELQQERDQLQSEHSQLQQRIMELRSSTAEDREKLERLFKGRLQDAEKKLKELRHKEKAFNKLERLQAQSEDMCRRLQSDIYSIKQQKVQLTKQMERSAKDFADWRKGREKEIMQLRRQGRQSQVQMAKLEALHGKQQAVLRRKTQEADAARKRLQEMIEVHKQTAEARGRGMSGLPPASTAPKLDCQPNASAPLLRDEKSRKDWIDRELDICNQSFDVQRVLEGEKALRSDAARRLRDVEKRLAVHRNPALILSSPLHAPGGPEDPLEQQRAELQAAIRQHSNQILEMQQTLLRAKTEEEQKGQGAADARRWNGLRNVAEARTMLRTVFRTASGHKAQVHEGQSDLTEAKEEAEMLRLQLDIALQDADAARNAAATAQAVAISNAAGSLTPPSGPSPSNLNADESHKGVESIMREIQRVSGTSQMATPPDAAAISAASCWEPARQQSQDVAGPSFSGTEDEGSEDGTEASANAEAGADQADESSDDGTWEPDMATPWRKGSKSRGASRLTRLSSSGMTDDERAMQEAWERPVLDAVNAERVSLGREPVSRLTVALLREHLRGKLVGGSDWRPGTKKRDALVQDYRDFMGLGLMSDIPSQPLPPASSAAAAAAAAHARSGTTTNGDLAVGSPIAAQPAALQLPVASPTPAPNGSPWRANHAFLDSEFARLDSMGSAPLPVQAGPYAGALHHASKTASPTGHERAVQGAPPSEPRVAQQDAHPLPPDSFATPVGIKTAGGNPPADVEEEVGTPRGAAEQAVMQARLAVVTALNSESKEASLTPAAQYYIKQHAEAVKRTQALRQKLNGRLNQAMSPIKHSAAAPSSTHTASGLASSEAAAAPPGPAASSASAFHQQLPVIDQVPPSVSIPTQSSDVPAIDHPSGEATFSRTANGFAPAVPASPRRQRMTWPEVPGTITAIPAAPAQLELNNHSQPSRVGVAAEGPALIPLIKRAFAMRWMRAMRTWICAPCDSFPGDLAMNAAKAGGARLPAGSSKTPAPGLKLKQPAFTPASVRAPFVPSSKGGWL